MTPQVSPRVRIVLVDDHPFVREGVRTVLESSPELEIVGEAASAEEGLEVIARTLPTIVLLDIGLGDRNGIHLTEELSARHPSVRVIVLSMYERATYMDSARRAGARGYVMKSSPPEVLRAAIQGVLAGLLVGFEPPLGTSPVELLTKRELEVARLCSQDFSDKEAAVRLDISVRTLEAHRQNIAHKLRRLQPPISATPVGLSRWLRDWGLLEDSR
ncbi:MAG TPA: response regulator transcription factor [Polyangiaceae bacterium]|nr:response regulator transcription factor [Polyangiaceae bacterium]